LTGKFGSNNQFGNGDIRNLDPQFQKERLQFGLKIMKKLKDIGSRYQKSPAQVAIAWVVAQEGIISALNGPSTIEHLEENIVSGEWQLSRDELEELNKYIKKEEDWLEKEQKETIKKIIYQDLAKVVEKSFVDLIYCIETAIANKYIKEKKIMPTFYKLYEMKNKLNHIDVEDLEKIQAEIKNIIPSNNI
jgi:hypothetical protein